MTDNIWSRFEGIATPDEVEESRSAFAPVPDGKFTAILNSIEATTTKEQGLPILETWWTLDTGRKFKFGILLQNLNSPDKTPMSINKAERYFSQLLGFPYQFEGMGKFANDINSFKSGGNYSIEITYGQRDTEKKYPNIKVLERLDAIPTVDAEIVDGDDDLPF